MGKQTTIYMHRYAKKVAPAVRAEVQRILTEANTKISVQGKASPKDEETWRLLIVWPAIAHLLHVPLRAQEAVIAMGKLCVALYSTYHKPSTLKCATVARRFQEEICPRLRSPYLLCLRRDARRVLDAIRPWGCAMFSGDVVESLNAFLKDIFLTATSRGGGKGTPEEQLIELLFGAMSGGFLYKEMPRDARSVLDAIRPWGCAMFSGDVVESLNAFLKDIFLTATSRGGGKGKPEEQLIELPFQAMGRGFLYKEMPRWREVEGLGALQIQHCADVAREYLGEMLESWFCIPMAPRQEEWFATTHTFLVGLNPFEWIQVIQVGHLNHVGLFKCHSNVVYFTCFDLSAAWWCSRWASSFNIRVYIKGPVVMADSGVH